MGQSVLIKIVLFDNYRSVMNVLSVRYERVIASLALAWFQIIGG